MLSVDLLWGFNFANLAKIHENRENLFRKQFLSLGYLILFEVTLLTIEHQLNYWNFHARKQVVPRDGNAEEACAKLSLFSKKSYRVKEGRAGTFIFGKKVHKQIYKYPSYLFSKCFSNLLPGLQVKSKFQIATFFSDTNHGKGSIGGTFTANVSLVPPVWRKIHSHCKNLKNVTASNWC